MKRWLAYLRDMPLLAFTLLLALFNALLLATDNPRIYDVGYG